MSWHLLSPDGSAPISAVEEIQGLYGSYTFPEKLLQKIWLRGDFDLEGMRTTDGRRVRVLYAGKWNLLGGPDFKNARICFDENGEVVGDVELHVHADGWAAHGHATDRAYDRVILHVVLFPPEQAHVTRGAQRAIPVVALLPLLHHDIEQYAAEDAVEFLANRPASRIHEILGPLPTAELMTLLRKHADERWGEKVHFARARVQRLGWPGACHHAALEILGYRFNRAPMLRIAGVHSPAEWARGAVDVDALIAREHGRWSLQGVRPANHPRVRLRQYSRWCAANPAWPSKLSELAGNLPDVARDLPSGAARRKHAFASLRAKISAEICADSVAGTRLDNLLCDGFLPLLSAAGVGDFRALWFNWYAGDLPPALGRSLRALGAVDGRSQPFAHGLGQGMLGWLLDQEKHVELRGKLRPTDPEA
ncbi:MAG: hypothetical protein JWM35_1343 [Verrucomicrobia bacterium]|nr:hypothetical protein [Verrucomicrobiota bacterium]